MPRICIALAALLLQLRPAGSVAAGEAACAGAGACEDAGGAWTQADEEEAASLRTSLLQSRRVPATPTQQVATETPGPASALAVGAASEARPVAISRGGDGRFRVQVGGRPLGPNGGVRGVAGYGYTDVASKMGVDALRTWDYGQWYWAFQNANRDGLMVSAGIGMTRDPKYYTEDEYCATNSSYWAGVLETILKQVDEYKHNRVLWWTVGNELEEQVSWSDGNDCLWGRVEWVAAKIKERDPNHPVGTVLANIHQNKVGKIDRLCPSLDFLGVNVYGNDAHDMGGRLRGMHWKRPYAITEYGVPGWWSVPTTSWGARLETMTSIAKKPFFVRTYNECAHDPQCVGSWAFLWGWKWEKTGTWFGLFDKWDQAKAKNYPVDTLLALKEAFNRGAGPQHTLSISRVLVHGKDGPTQPFIGFSAGPDTKVQIEVHLEGTGQLKEIVWLVTPESDSHASGNSHEDALRPIHSAIHTCGDPKRALLDTSKLDVNRGRSYRLYVFARNVGAMGMVESSASIPFFIGEQQCHTARHGEPCYNEVQRAQKTAQNIGVPQWPAGALLSTASFEEFQAALYKEHRGGCSAPCSLEVPSSAAGSCAGGSDSGGMEDSGEEENENEPSDESEPSCGSALPGSKCDKDVSWAMHTGFRQHSDWYPGLQASSSRAEFQRFFHDTDRSGCPMPCEFTTTTTTTTLPCEDAKKDSKCGHAIKWAMQTGIRQHPEWYPGLSRESTYKDFQEFLFEKNSDDCERPCKGTPSPTPSPPRPTPSPTPSPTPLPSQEGHAGGSAEATSCTDETHSHSPCASAVNWAMSTGIRSHPDWYPGLTASSSFPEFQRHLHEKNEPHGNTCPFPCSLTTTTTTTIYCHDAEENSKCKHAVDWAMHTGIRHHPEWYPGLKPSSSFKEFQGFLYEKGDSECELPCMGPAPAPDDPTPYCHDAAKGELCDLSIQYALSEGIARKPADYPGLTTASSPRDVQAFMNERGINSCPRPCA